MTLKFSDLKPGDKINYRSNDSYEWCDDIGVYVRSENDRHWFKWHDFGYTELSLYANDVAEIRYAKESEESSEYCDLQTYSNQELIEELRKRGFKGTLSKTVTQNITL